VLLPVLQRFLLFSKVGIYAIPAKDFLSFPNVGKIIMNLSFLHVNDDQALLIGVFKPKDLIPATGDRTSKNS
jgi:hypothetical protein